MFLAMVIPQANVEEPSRTHWVKTVGQRPDAVTCPGDDYELDVKVDNS
jgi:hypothetical protein